MSGIGLSLNPLSILDPIFDLSGDQEARDTSMARSEEQRRLDNAWRRNQEYRRQAERTQDQIRDDAKLQRLVSDAQKAGIGVNAALGGGVQSPMSISVPAGQGGRVHGTYHRQSPMELSISTRILLATAKKTEAEAESAQVDTEKKKKELVQLGVIPRDPNMPPPERLPPVNAIQDYYDPQSGHFEWLDPEFAESLDSVGGLFYMGVREGMRNVKDFWQRSQQYRHQKMYGE